MRSRNWRVILTGFVLMVLVLGFYLFMLTVASQSTDPVAFIRLWEPSQESWQASALR